MLVLIVGSQSVNWNRACFSFNAPFGACPDCDGLGVKLEVDKDLVIPDPTKTLREGAIVPWNPISSQYYPQMLEQAATSFWD